MTSKRNTPLKAGSYYLFGNIFNKAIAFLTIPIFTRLLTTSEYGIVNTYLSWVTILSVIIGLSLGNSIRNAYIDFKNDLEEYISSIFSLSILNFIIFSIIILSIWHLFGKDIDELLVILCLVQAFMTFISDSISIRYMMDMEYMKRTILLSLPNIIVAILSVLLIINMTNKKYYGRIIPYVIVYSFIGITYLIVVYIKGKRIIDLRYWKYALKISLPLVFHGLSLTILSNIDRTMITAFRGASETGIYSIVYNLSMIIIAVTSALESVWIPWFTDKMQKNEKKIINKEVKLYIEIIVFLIICILMISPEILVIIAPREYWSGKELIPPIILASFIIFLYSISVDVEYYYKSTKNIAFNTMIAALINIILNYIFVPKYGAVAAAYITVFSYFISFIMHYYNARKIDKDLFPLNIYIKPIIYTIFFVILTYIFLDKAIIRWVIAIVVFWVYIIIALKQKKFSMLIRK